MTFSQSAERLVAIGSDFHRRGWALGTSGNFSVVLERDPLVLAITASSLDKGKMRPEQILRVGGDGTPLPGIAGRPSAETLLHLAIARTVAAGAILHTHSVWSTILSDHHAGRAGFFIEQYEMLKGLSGVMTHEHREWLPILENSQDLALLAKEATATILDNPAMHGFLIRRHGLYTWGVDLDEAVRHVEILEFLLESVGRRQMMEPA
jgi:methylthioribulose-1-phosphate dehydratase